MFRKILVPLDGSQLSEASLIPASVVADRFGSSVTLIHVIEQNPPAEVHGQRHLTTRQEASAYLREVAVRAIQPGIRVDIHVHEAPVADVADSIVKHASDEIKADLIVTCTHGKGGVRELLFGSIAHQIVAQGKLPLLLIKPGLLGFAVKKLLIPLDPDSLHDSSLEPAVEFATAFQASLELLTVIPTVGTLTGEEAATSSLMPITTKAVLQFREQQAGEHLQQHVEALREKGLSLSALVARGESASEIVRAADHGSSDIIVLTTHRKAGLGAFWSKSVAPRVAQTTRKPVLLIPLPWENQAAGRLRAA